MSDAPAPRAAVTVNVAPAFEERVADWLLARDTVAGFTSYLAFGHSARHDGLTAAEQVSGRQRRVEFRAEIEAAALDDFVAALHARFAGADLYYSVMPILRSGHLQELPQ